MQIRKINQEENSKYFTKAREKIPKKIFLMFLMNEL